MTLEQRVTKEMKAAMKSGDKERLTTIRSLRASILEFAKSGSDKELDEKEEIKMLNQAAKKRKDAIQMYADAGRDELKEKEEKELAIIMEFLPKQLSKDELSKIVDDVITKVGATGPADMGKVMGMTMKEVSGKADGNAVQSVVKEKLNNL